MTRFCVCISGQIRAPAAALRSLRKVTEGHDVTAIFSVWDRVGRKLTGALNYHQLFRMFDVEAYLALPSAWHGLNRLWEALPNLLRQLDNAQASPQAALIESLIRESFPAAIADVEPSDLLDLSFVSPVQDSNSIRMTYKIWRANQIKRRLERDTGKFDVVLWCRPDLVVDLDLDHVADRVSRGKFLVSSVGDPQPVWVDDFFAAGSSSAMDAYCAIFGRAIGMPQSWKLIHIDLFRHLQACSLDVEAYNFKRQLADEEQIPFAQYLTALRELHETREVWDQTHELALVAARALEAARAQDAPAALDILREAAPAAAEAELPVADSFLLVMSQVLSQLKEPDAADACALAAAGWDPQIPPWDPRRRLAVDAVIGAVVRHLDPLRALESAAIAEDLVRNLRPSWVAELLAGILGGPSLESWLATRIASMLPQLDVRQATLRVFRDTRNLTGLAQLAVDVEGDLVAERENNPDATRRVPLLLLVADAYGALGEKGRAILALREAADCSPTNIHVIYLLANMLKVVEQYEEARIWQSRAVAADPSHAGACRQLAELCLHLGDAEAGLHHARRSAELNDTPAHRLLVAFSLRRLGSPKADAIAAGLPAELMQSAIFGKIPGMQEFKAQFA